MTIRVHNDPRGTRCGKCEHLDCWIATRIKTGELRKEYSCAKGIEPFPNRSECGFFEQKDA